MKALRLKQLWTLALAGVGAVALAFPVTAGDKIIVSDEKGSSDPNRDVRLGNELFKARTKLDQPGFDSSILGLPTLPRVAPMSRKEELRQKRKQEEKENWLLIPSGETERREHDETTFGVANRPLDGLDKEGSKGYGTFYGLGEAKTTPGQRLPGELRAPNSKQDQAEARQAAQQARERIDAEEETRRQSNKTFDLGGGTESGAHTASELNFSKMLEPGKSETPSLGSAGNPEFSLRSLMGTAPVRTKDQQGRMDEFNKLINVSAQQSSLFSGSSAFSAQPAGGASAGFAKPPEPAPSRPASDLFGQNPGNFSGGSPNRLPTPGLPTFNNTPSYNPSSPFQRPTPAVQDSTKTWMKPMEPQRRKF